MTALLVIQVIICTLLISAIQLQSKGTGLGSSVGSASQSYHSKRGFEKVLFRLTIGLAIVFVFVSLLALI